MVLFTILYESVLTTEYENALCQLTRVFCNQNNTHCDNRNKRTGEQIQTNSQPAITRHHHKESLCVVVLIPGKHSGNKNKNCQISRLPVGQDSIASVSVGFLGAGVVVRALVSHQCGLGSILGPDVIYGLSLLLVFSVLKQAFSGYSGFPSPQPPPPPPPPKDNRIGIRSGMFLQV